MSESRATVDPEEILSYWFPPGYDAHAATFRQQVLCWFQGGPEVDQEISKLFAPVLEQARRGKPLEQEASLKTSQIAVSVEVAGHAGNLKKEE